MTLDEFLYKNSSIFEGEVDEEKIYETVRALTDEDFRDLLTDVAKSFREEFEDVLTDEILAFTQEDF